MEIQGLYKAKKQDRKRALETLKEAFQDYPKLTTCFSSKKDQKAAMDATIHFFCSYALKYGAVFSLDNKLHEALCLVHSNQMSCTEERFHAAGSYNEDFRKIMQRLSPEQQQTWWDFFDDFDRLEALLDLPLPHLYVDFLGVIPAFQHQGRGRKLMTHIFHYAQSVSLPIMLFNSADLVPFYEKLGFETVATVHSDAFDTSNIYMLCYP